MKLCAVICSSIIVCSNSFAASLAKYAGEFMSMGVGARALGMGGAAVAVANDVTCAYWNPAGVARLQYPEIAVMHAEQFAGMVNFDYAGIALPFKKTGGLAFSLIRVGVDDIPYTAVPRPDLRQDTVFVDEGGRLVVNRPYIYRTVSDAEYAAYFSYGRQYNRQTFFGVNAKIVRKDVGDHSAWGIGFDIAGVWNPWRQLRLGINLQDATTTLLVWNTLRKELIAPTLKSGIYYPIALPKWKSRILLAADSDMRFEGREYASDINLGAVSLNFRLGTEFVLRNLIAVRVGRDDLGCLTAGAGFALPRLFIDYAFMNHTDLRETHRVSIRLRLEEERFKRR